MSAGLPGIGLSGIFFIVSALLMPFVEALRALQGRSSRREWVFVLRQAFMAGAVVAALIGFWSLLLRLARTLGPTGVGVESQLVAPDAAVAVPLGLAGTLLLALLLAVQLLRLLLQPTLLPSSTNRPEVHEELPPAA